MKGCVDRFTFTRTMIVCGQYDQIEVLRFERTIKALFRTYIFIVSV